MAAEKSIAKGRTLRRAFRWSRRVWQGKEYADGRAVRFSYPTLLREFYKWKAHGRNPAAVALHYQTRRIVSPAIVAQFVRRCAAPGVTHFQAAYRALSPSTRRAVKFGTLDKNLAPALRARLLKLFSIRRSAIRCEQLTGSFITRFLAEGRA